MNEQSMKKNIEKMGYNLTETLASRGKRRGHFYCSPSKRPREYHLSDARKYWQFPPSSIGRAKFSTKEMLTWSDSKIKNFIERSIGQRNKKQDTTAYLNKVSKWILNENVHHVLDFGCGLGQDGVYFSLLGIQITFADIISSNIEFTKRYPNIWNIPTESLFINTDPKDFVFPEKYDMIFSKGVLHHVPEAKAIVKNLAKYLKKGRLFICMLYTPAHFKATGARSLEEYAILSEGAAPVLNPHTDYYTKERAEFLFEGFILQDYWKTNKGKFGWYVFRRLD